MAERDCEGCGDLTEIKHLGKIRGKLLCKKCRSSVRKDHREETINQESEEEREKIRELSRRAKSEYNKAYNKIRRKENLEKSPPKIKGSKIEKKKPKSNSYLTFEDKKQLLRILLAKGLSFEEAKDRLNGIATEQERIRKIMQSNNKSEEEIKIKQQEMIEELWSH